MSSGALDPIRDRPGSGADAVTPDTKVPETAASGGLAVSSAEAIADALNACGFDVSSPGRPGSSFLQVTNVSRAFCDLTVYDSGVFDWRYHRRDSSRADPAILAVMALRILGGDRTDATPLDIAHDPHLTLKDQVGHALAGQGMHAELNALDEMAMTNPADPGRGIVCVADDGTITWHCRINDPQDPARGLGLHHVTEALSLTLAAAGLSEAR
jgi:hypothetical protein